MISTATIGDRCISTSNRQPTGFFNLPREIRDVIYDYSIISMRDDRWIGHRKAGAADWTALCHCQQDTLVVLRPRPPYFAFHAQSCLVPDRFLHSISLVSKQFAAELRPVFFQQQTFQIDASPHNDAHVQERWGGRLLEDSREFIYALGSEAKQLRRLMMVMRDEKDRDSGSEVSTTPKDAEQALLGMDRHLHQAARVLLVIRKDQQTGGPAIFFFGCKLSADDNTRFLVENLNEDDWEEYLECA